MGKTIKIRMSQVVRDDNPGCFDDVPDGEVVEFGEPCDENGNPLPEDIADAQADAVNEQYGESSFDAAGPGPRPKDRNGD
jgi:hypothetical protein